MLLFHWRRAQTLAWPATNAARLEMSGGRRAHKAIIGHDAPERSSTDRSLTDQLMAVPPRANKNDSLLGRSPPKNRPSTRAFDDPVSIFIVASND